LSTYQVLSLEQFNHLGFLLKSVHHSSEVVPLCQTAPFFANSDPDMPAAPVPLPAVVDWVLEHLHLSSDRPKEGLKEKGLDSDADDITMVDACPSSSALPTNDDLVNSTSKHTSVSVMDVTSVDGITKASILKDEKDINRGSVKVRIVLLKIITIDLYC
jgi:TBCC domain-containing protein 1